MRTRDPAQQAGYLWLVFAVVLCFNLPFIICDFVFAGKGGCVDSQIDGISITLATWLQVDGICRIVICSLFLICALTYFISQDGAMLILGISFCILIFYSLFSFAWLITGAVMFWGHLNKTNECSGGVSGYMNAVLIIGFVGVCLNSCFSKNNSF